MILVKVISVTGYCNVYSTHSLQKKKGLRCVNTEEKQLHVKPECLKEDGKSTQTYSYKSCQSWTGYR